MIDVALQQSFDAGFNDPEPFNPLLIKEQISPLYELAKREFNTSEFTVVRLKIDTAKNFEISEINGHETPCFSIRAEFTVNRLDVEEKIGDDKDGILSYIKVSCSACSDAIESPQGCPQRFNVSWKVNGAVNGLYSYTDEEEGGDGTFHECFSTHASEEDINEINSAKILGRFKRSNMLLPKPLP